MSTLIDSANSHETLFELLPWYVNGSLSSDEFTAVAKHIEQCPACAAESDWLHQLYEDANAGAELYPISNGSFERIRSQIETSPSAHEDSPPLGSAWLAQIRSFLQICAGSRVSWAVVPVAFVSLVVVFLNRPDPQIGTISDPQFTTLSNESGAHKAIGLSIRPSTLEAQQKILQVMNELGAKGTLRLEANGELR